MSAILRMLSYSIETMISKIVLKGISPIKYLANKYLIGILIYMTYFLYSDKMISKQGIFFLSLSTFLTVINQVISFSSLKLISSSTHVLMRQIKIIFLLVIGAFLGYSITLNKILAGMATVVGTIFVINDEQKQSDNRKDTLVGILLSVLGSVLGISNVYVLEYSLKNRFFNPPVYTLVTILSVMAFYIVLDKLKNNKVQDKINKKLFWLIQLTGILSICVNFTKAISYEYVGYFISEIIYATSPMFILIVLSILKIEKITLKKVTGIVLGFIGVYFALLS